MSETLDLKCLPEVLKNEIKEYVNGPRGYATHRKKYWFVMNDIRRYATYNSDSMLPPTEVLSYERSYIESNYQGYKHDRLRHATFFDIFIKPLVISFADPVLFNHRNKFARQMMAEY